MLFVHSWSFLFLSLTVRLRDEVLSFYYECENCCIHPALVLSPLHFLKPSSLGTGHHTRIRTLLRLEGLYSVFGNSK